MPPCSWRPSGRCWPKALPPLGDRPPPRGSGDAETARRRLGRRVLGFSRTRKRRRQENNTGGGGGGGRVRGQGSGGKGQGARVRGQGSGGKGQAARVRGQGSGGEGVRGGVQRGVRRGGQGGQGLGLEIWQSRWGGGGGCLSGARGCCLPPS